MSNTITLSYTNDFKPINNHIPCSIVTNTLCQCSIQQAELELLNANRGNKK